MRKVLRLAVLFMLKALPACASSYEIDRDRALIYEKVQPGVPNPGAVTFEVAPDSSRFTLYIGDLAYPQNSQVARIVL